MWGALILGVGFLLEVSEETATHMYYSLNS